MREKEKRDVERVSKGFSTLYLPKKTMRAGSVQDKHLHTSTAILRDTVLSANPSLLRNNVISLCGEFIGLEDDVGNPALSNDAAAVSI